MKGKNERIATLKEWIGSEAHKNVFKKYKVYYSRNQEDKTMSYAHVFSENIH